LITFAEQAVLDRQLVSQQPESVNLTQKLGRLDDAYKSMVRMAKKGEYRRRSTPAPS
jgi:hypothetical protein